MKSSPLGKMDENPFADPSVVEAQRAAANAPIEEDNPFAEDVGKF